MELETCMGINGTRAKIGMEPCCAGTARVDRDPQRNRLLLEFKCV